MVKHTQTFPWQKSMNCLSMFDHFVGLALRVTKLVKQIKFKVAWGDLKAKTVSRHNYEQNI